MDGDIERSSTTECNNGLGRKCRYLEENQYAEDALKRERWNGC